MALNIKALTMTNALTLAPQAVPNTVLRPTENREALRVRIRARVARAAAMVIRPRLTRSASLPLLTRAGHPRALADVEKQTCLINSNTPSRVSRPPATRSPEDISRSWPTTDTDMNEIVETVHATQATVRQHFRPRKSANKCRISDLRVKPAATPDLVRVLNTFDILAPLQAADAPLIKRLQANVGNCHEMASYAHHIAERLGLSSSIWALRDPELGHGAHAFCVIAEPGNYAARAKPANPLQGRGWVIDPWAGIVCDITDYDARIRQKMAKWAGEKKHIFCSERQTWMSPIDPRWLDALAVKHATPSLPLP